MSHNVWQTTYGADGSVIGATLVIEGHPFTVAGVTPPGFFGETLRGDPPDLWIPLHQEPLINGETSILRQPVSAWLRVIGRLRPGATVDGVGPRLTGILHQWLQQRGDAARRSDLTDQLDRPDVDTQLERGGRHQRLEVAGPQP